MPGSRPGKTIFMDRQPGIRPRQGIWHTLDTASRHGFPAVQTIAVLLLLSAPFGIPGQAQLQPGWAQACVYFWSLYRPAAMPAPLIFAIGLLLDLLAQGPIGIEVLILLLIHAFALKARRSLTRSGFATVWLVFIGVALAAAALEWVLMCALTWHALPPWPGLFECGLAAGMYPFLALYLIMLHRGRAAPEQAS
jgi:rod shape-determining protein MreD